MRLRTETTTITMNTASKQRSFHVLGTGNPGSEPSQTPEQRPLAAVTIGVWGRRCERLHVRNCIQLQFLFTILIAPVWGTNSWRIG
jgi:hypothetical protein